MNSKFKIGDTVQLVGIYRRDKMFNKTKGVITEYSIDHSQYLIGGSIHVYVVADVGTYGESALILAK